jgi:hypothetical protein
MAGGVLVELGQLLGRQRAADAAVTCLAGTAVDGYVGIVDIPAANFRGGFPSRPAAKRRNIAVLPHAAVNIKRAVSRQNSAS